MTIKLGIIGLGVISRYYLDALGSDGEVDLVAVCDVDPARLGSEPGIARFTDHRDLLEAGVDAVVVNVPNSAHHAVCRDALARRVHVCVEKPLATDVDDGRELADLARATATTLFTAFHRRYNTNFVRLLAGLRGRPAITHVRVRYLEDIVEHAGRDSWYLDPSRCGGGCVADNGPNAYDLVRALIGELDVVGAAIEGDPHGVERRATVDLRSPAGATATVELDWGYTSGEVKDVVVRLADGSVAGADLLAGYPAFKSSLAHEYVDVLADFVRSIRDGGCHGDDGLDALRLVTDTYDMAWSGAASTGARR